MNSTFNSENFKYTCDECKNQAELSQDTIVGDIIECQFCGIEYEITSTEGNGVFTLSLLEEEK